MSPCVACRDQGRFSSWLSGRDIDIRGQARRPQSSCKRGPVVISDSDDNLEPLQRKPIRQDPPELVKEVKEMRNHPFYTLQDVLSRKDIVPCVCEEAV